MRLPRTIRVLLLALPAAGTLAGCGSPAAPGVVVPTARPSRSAQAQHAPRQLDLPPGVQPLHALAAEPAAREPAAIVQCQKTSPLPPARSGRITEISAAADRRLTGTIREPSAAQPEVREPAPPAEATAASPALAPPSPARSAFVPLPEPAPDPGAAAPQAGAAGPAVESLPPQPSLAPEPPPTLAATPAFDNPSIPSRADTAEPVANRFAPGATSLPQFVAAQPPAASAAEQIPLLAERRNAPGPQFHSALPPAAGPGQSPLLPPTAAPSASPAANSPLAAVSQQAAQISERAHAMAQRGMIYAARNELIKSLRLIAQALDVQSGGNRHSTALASGLAALDEARDFAASTAGAPNVADIAAGHRTTVLKNHAAASEMSPVIAQQQYFAYAQEQLIAASGGLPVSSQILYRLGRLQTAEPGQESDSQALGGARAMVFQQAALAVDGGNYLAANELGVLLARYGQLQEAKQLLLRSVAIKPQVESWHNLAVVHRRLGEADLAARAENERDLARRSAPGRAASDLVRWVDPPTFAAAGGPDVPWPETQAPQLSSSPEAGKRR